MLEEAAEGLCQLPQVIGEVVGEVFAGGSLQGFREAEQLQGQSPLAGVGDLERRGLRAEALLGHIPFAEDAAAAGVGILHVGGGVPVGGEHFVITEDVIARAILAEIGIFDRSDAHGFGDGGDLLFAQVREFVALGEPFLTGLLVFVPSQADSLFDQLFEFRRSSRAGSEGAAVFSQDRAKADVVQFDLVVAPAAGLGEQGAEVQRLAGVHHVQNGVRLEMLDAVADGGQVGGQVGEGAVPLAEDARRVVPLPLLRGARNPPGRIGNDHRPFAFFGQTPCEHFLHDRRQKRMVETFP